MTRNTRNISKLNYYLFFFFFPNHSSNTNMVEERGSFAVSVGIGKVGGLFSVLFELSFHELTWMCKCALWK